MPNEKSKRITTKKRVREFSNANKCKFERAVSLVNWNLTKSFDDVQFAISVFYIVLSFFFDTCFPWKTVRFRNTDPPWMNTTLKILIDRRHRAFHKKHKLKYLRLRAHVINYTRSRIKEKIFVRS